MEGSVPIRKHRRIGHSFFYYNWGTGTCYWGADDIKQHTPAKLRDLTHHLGDASVELVIRGVVLAF